MNVFVELLSWLALLGGLFFAVVGSIGLLRLPDFYTRLHASGMIDTLGMSLILLGLMLKAGWTLITAKLALICLFILITSPTATHALVRAALHDPANPQPLLDDNGGTPPSRS